MNRVFDERQPIYQQMIEWIKTSVLAGDMLENEAIPSLRAVSTKAQVNPLTVQKAYQELQALGVLELRRGRGFYVVTGAQSKLLAAARKEFQEKEMPRFKERARLLGFTAVDITAWFEDDLEENND